jgi:hypothetical protein
MLLEVVYQFDGTHYNTTVQGESTKVLQKTLLHVLARFPHQVVFGLFLHTTLTFNKEIPMIMVTIVIKGWIFDNVEILTCWNSS